MIVPINRKEIKPSIVIKGIYHISNYVKNIINNFADNVNST
jgi:hypothetical protein